MRRTVKVLALVAAMSIQVPVVALGSHTNSEKYHWVPRVGRSFVGQDGRGRYTDQFVKWNYAYQLEYLQRPQDAFELETHFYCYDDRCFFGGLYDGSTRGVHWDTNLPGAYLDTAFLDNADQPTPTVGSHDMAPAREGVLYRAWIRFKSGNAGSDRGQIRVVQGITETWCSSEWCVGEDESEKVVDSWSMPIPTAADGYRWTWGP